MILVTGGAGYIGSHTCVELLKNGYEIAVVDNFVNSHPKAVDRVKEISGKEFTFYNADVCDEAAMETIFAAHDFDCVIHFAGLKAVGESVAKPLMYYENNIGSTVVLLKVMDKYDVRRIIFSSSATVYSGVNPMPLTEDSVLGCINPYGWTKYMCEQIISDYTVAQPKASAVLLRYFNPIGAHESGEIGEDPQDIPNNLMPYIAQTAVGRREFLRVYGDDYNTPDGTGVRDYIHVTDLAAGHAAAIKYLENHQGVTAFNLGTGKGTSVLELVLAFEKASGVSISKKIVERRPGDLPVCYATTDKARQELGWSARKTIADACADTWRWQSKNPDGYTK
jgi:UDP-glucose 4-epimerase